MSSELGWFASTWWQRRTAAQRALLYLSAIAGFAFFLRCLHLFNTEKYYLLSADSYFFHWLAGRLMAGAARPPGAEPEAIYHFQNGLAYPLAYIAKATSYIFRMSSGHALDIVCRFLPPVLAVLSVIVIYVAATRAFERRVGLFAAFAYALMLHAIFVGASGYIDRDGLTTLLMMLGAFAFYFAGRWKLRIGSRDVGWLAAALVVLTVEALLYLEWSVVGAALLMVVLVAYCAVRSVMEVLWPAKAKGADTSRRAAIGGALDWRTFAFIVGGNIVAGIVFFPQAIHWAGILAGLLGYGGESAVSELQGLTLGDLGDYHLFLIPMVIGLYVAFKRRSNAGVFTACWFVCLLLLSFFARRILYFAVPAAAVLAGVGLAYLWEWARGDQSHSLKKVAVPALLLLLVLVSFVSAASLGSSATMAANREWQDALSYLRSETPENAVVMSQWGWGYYILDLGNRTPFVDNGFFGYPPEKLHDVGLAYGTADPAEAAQVMKRNGAGYLVFSKIDQQIAPLILDWAGMDGQEAAFPQDSLYSRSINGNFTSSGALGVVHRSAPDSEVVILELAQWTQAE
jgi:asparagine N-glycosylation enzyme membrane subunit Stt3